MCIYADWTTPDGDNYEGFDNVDDEDNFEINHGSYQHDNNTGIYDYNNDDHDEVDSGNDDCNKNPTPYDEVDIDKENDLEVNDFYHNSDSEESDIEDHNQHQAHNTSDKGHMGSRASGRSSGKLFSFIVTMLWLTVYCT